MPIITMCNAIKKIPVDIEDPVNVLAGMRNCRFELEASCSSSHVCVSKMMPYDLVMEDVEASIGLFPKRYHRIVFPCQQLQKAKLFRTAVLSL
jgi:hypothetical protein